MPHLGKQVTCLRIDTSGKQEHVTRMLRYSIYDEMSLGDVSATLQPEESGTLGDAAFLVAWEMVQNAYKHAGGPSEIRISRRDNALTIEVDDPSKVSPEIAPMNERGEFGGYGLILVHNLTDSWGVHRSDKLSGKTVYARITGR
ncbi:ATP-binding protein [Streptomyces sp. NPDC048362]|uniref:ATP-binding protein n=1 Tax=Streptomyces sp. NPDC048362 TaxID=3365539 RepID=UPI00371855CB